jgi:hypothetical protein
LTDFKTPTRQKQVYFQAGYPGVTILVRIPKSMMLEYIYDKTLGRLLETFGLIIFVKNTALVIY